MILTIAQVSDAVFLALLQPQLVSNITATGTNQATALVLTAAISIVTVTPSGSGVVLPQSGSPQVVNRGANDLLVYPSSGWSIEIQAANAPVIIPSGGSATFILKSANAWVVT